MTPCIHAGLAKTNPHWVYPNGQKKGSYLCPGYDDQDDPPPDIIFILRNADGTWPAFALVAMGRGDPLLNSLALDALARAAVEGTA